MCLGGVDRLTDLNRTADRRVGLRSTRAERDARRRLVRPVALLERLLDRLQVHLAATLTQSHCLPRPNFACRASSSPSTRISRSTQVGSSAWKSPTNWVNGPTFRLVPNS